MEIPSQSSLYTHIALPAETDKREPGNKDNGAVVAQTQTAELGHARGVKTSRPAWLKKAMFRDDTVVQTEHGPGHIQNSRSSQRWEDDQFDANRPADEFLLSIHRHLAHRWANDRAAAFDQVSNGSYAASRRAELRAIPGAGYLAEQYGLQTARDNISRTRPGLRIDNRLSASYQRTSPNDGLRSQCLSIYRSLGHTHPPEMVVFVNSEINASRTLAMLDDWKPASGLVGKATCNVQPLKRGLVALEFHSPPQFAEQAGKILAKLGGRPSSYEVGKIAYAARTPFKPSSRLGKEIDNHKMLFGTLSEDSKLSISALKKLSAGHAMRTTANCAASLLDGLRKELFEKVDTPQFKHDVLIANALNALINTVRALPTMTEDSARFFAGYAAMLEELHLVLAAVKPYEESDFKQAAAAMLATRIRSSLPGLQIATPETYLLSSGMEAISMGVEIAQMLNNTTSVLPLARQQRPPDYFETLSMKTSWSRQDLIRTALLNPSYPKKVNVRDTIHNWDAGKLVQQMGVWLDTLAAEKLVQQVVAWLTGEWRQTERQPAVLVLDITVEKQEAEGISDLTPVLAKLQPYINDGRLKIVLCKSYQKYTTLGSAKIMAGAVTLIARDDPGTQAAAARLRQAEEDLGWMHSDESQLLTHFLMHAHASELEMIEAAAKNAAFIDRFCCDALRSSGKFKVHREDKLPFVVTTAGFQEMVFSRKKEMRLSPSYRLLLHQVENRNSFGFLSTSITLISNDMRITIGQEAREELVEKLYGFMWLAKAGLGVITPVEMAAEAKRIAENAMRVVLGETDVTSWAQTALQVLRNRASRGTGAEAAAVGECEALLDEIAGMPATLEAYSANGLEERKDLLRLKLEKALNISEPLAESLLSDHLRIVGSAFAPRLSGAALSENDVDAMRTAIKRSYHDDSLGSAPILNDYLSARYAPNAVASLLVMAGLGFAPQEVADRFRQDLELLYSAVLNAGLPGVSPATRADIIQAWSRLQSKKFDSSDKELQRAAINELVRHVRLSPYRETGAKILESIPGDMFACLERPAQRQLIDVLFAPLDVNSRLAFIQNLARRNKFDKLSACIERFGEDLKQLDEGVSSLLVPDDLSRPAELLIDEPRPFTLKEAADIRENLLAVILHQRHEGLGDRMEAWAPWICNDEKSANQLAEIVRMFEAAQSASGVLSDAQYKTLSDQVELLSLPYRQVMRQYFEEFVRKSQDQTT